MAKRGYVSYKPRARRAAWLRSVNEILTQYQNDWPLTVRQVFYRLVAAFDYPKDEKAYGKLVEMIGLARRASRVEDTETTVPFKAIRDDSMRVIDPFFYEDERDFMESMKDYARHAPLNRQEGQDQITEFWCEAAGVVPILSQVANPYSIRVNSCGGFDSITAKDTLALRATRNWNNHGLKTIVVHVGDFDPSGENMAEVLSEDVGMMVRQLTGTWEAFEVHRLALTDQQVIDRDIITAPPKEDDSRMAGFVARHQDLAEQLGTTDIAAQLEALTPPELRELFEDFIEETFDRAVYDERLAEESELQDTLLAKIDKIDTEEIE